MMMDLTELRNALVSSYTDVTSLVGVIALKEKDLEEAEMALADRRAEILREYGDPNGAHALNGGIKKLGSNEEQRKAALDGMTGAERREVAVLADELRTRKASLERARLNLQLQRDLLRLAEMERSIEQIAIGLLGGIAPR